MCVLVESLIIFRIYICTTMSSKWAGSKRIRVSVGDKRRICNEDNKQNVKDSVKIAKERKWR